MNSRHKPTQPTYVVELTPRGRGALAVVLVAGPDAICAVDDYFAATSGRPLLEQLIGRITLGRWGGPDGEELVACRRAADRVEIHCHGGVAAVQSVIDALVQRGCQPISWQEWLRLASDDPLRAAAHVALAEAPTARTAAILLDQYHGALSAAVRESRDAALAGEWTRAAAAMDALLTFRDLGQHLVKPWRVVLAGPPNVGKSSLMNALVGYQRAIVCDLPGTTRDVVTATTAIDGWPIQLCDTAGLRDVDTGVEAAGVALAEAAMAAADLVLAVHDATDSRRDWWARVSVPNSVRALHVLSKIDLVSSSQIELWEVSLRPNESQITEEDRRRRRLPHFLPTSAITGEGIDVLVAAICRTLVPLAPSAGTAVPFTADQVAALDAARAAAARGDANGVCEALQPLLAGKAIADCGLRIAD